MQINFVKCNLDDMKIENDISRIDSMHMRMLSNLPIANHSNFTLHQLESLKQNHCNLKQLDHKVSLLNVVTIRR